MQKKLVETKKKFADLRINLPLKNYRTYNFGKDISEQLIKIGYNETIKLMPKIKKIIKKAEENKK